MAGDEYYVLWDPADGPEPTGPPADSDGWSEREWMDWYHDQSGPEFVPDPTPRVTTVDPGGYL